MRLVRSVALLVLFTLTVAQGFDWATTSAHTNQCSRWATMIGKEGHVRDSSHMHFLGCDSNPQTGDAHYDAYDMGGCAREARAIVRSNPSYFVYRPLTVARLVMERNGWCNVYEDGSYSYY